MNDQPRRKRIRSSRRYNTLRKLTAPEAFGWPLLIASTILFIIDAFPFLGSGDLAGSGFKRTEIVFQAALLAQLPIIMILGLARLTWLRLRFSCRHPMIALVTLFVATLFADVVFQGHIAASSNGRYLAKSVFDQVLYKTAALAFFTILIVDLNDFRNRLSALKRTQLTLAASARIAKESMTEERSRVNRIIERSMTLARSGLSNSNLADTGHELRNIASEIVRPLSLELMQNQANFAPPEVPKVPRQSWRHTINQIAAAPLIAPRTLAIAIVILGWRQTVSFDPVTSGTGIDDSVAVTFDPVLFLEAISVLAVLFFGTWYSASFVSHILTRKTAQKTTRAKYAFNFIGIVSVSLSVFVLLLISYQLPWFPEPPEVAIWTPLTLFVPVLLVSAIQGFLRSLQVRRTALLDEISTANDDLQWFIASTNERIWFQRKTLAQHIHGPIQGRLNACSLRLINLAARNLGELEKTQELALIREQMQNITNDILNDVQSIPLEAKFLELHQLWRDVCDVTWSISPFALDRIQDNAPCLAVIDQISQESVANAVTHGRAKMVTISITPCDDRTVRIVVLDNGIGVHSSSMEGLGTRLLNEITTQWTRVADSHGTTLTADVPIPLDTI